ncbi:hypothetical protein EI77_00320 [Prosthecobacter fusiformis]|uniref:Uncharacterized protein n=1 Tax=Prosthecobacter fusiformis TaxID=48464 RepID=A0A4R7SS62_9BACT|nr:hypothetical protein [Prosthecobacter fusiformis]TDU81018.1 hypothetical protein EI77_00320 [Prosthecobacter fusiformis]
MPLRPALCLSLTVLLSACISSTPTAEKLDELERNVRAEYRQEYVMLEDQRRTGTLSGEEYTIAKSALDKRVQNRVDTMAWSRHALVQSDMKAHAIPTPDKPQKNLPPGVGTLQGSVYNAQRQNGIGNQAMGNLMQELGGTDFNQRRAGTLYDQ